MLCCGTAARARRAQSLDRRALPRSGDRRSCREGPAAQPCRRPAWLTVVWALTGARRRRSVPAAGGGLLHRTAQRALAAGAPDRPVRGAHPAHVRRDRGRCALLPLFPGSTTVVATSTPTSPAAKAGVVPAAVLSVLLARRQATACARSSTALSHTSTSRRPWALARTMWSHSAASSTCGTHPC